MPWPCVNKYVAVAKLEINTNCTHLRHCFSQYHLGYFVPMCCKLHSSSVSTACTRKSQINKERILHSIALIDCEPICST